MKKNDLWLIGVILFFALAGGIFFQFSKETGAKLKVTVDGKEYGIYDLREDQEIEIGDTNICRIEDGVVRMVQAECPDQLCIHQKAIDKRGGTIVCLPNRVVLEITGAVRSHNEDAQPDSVAS